MGSTISLTDLTDCLTNIEPVELKGMRLLKAHSSSAGFFPDKIPRTEVKEAVVELVNYTQECQKVTHRLCQLMPIPLLNLEQLEFGI